MASIILFGLISYSRLGISQLPDVDFPVVSVSLNLPGAAPEVVESQVLDPLEDAIMEIDGIRSVNSTAQQSSGSIAVEFELDRDIDKAMQEIQNKINQVQNILPTTLFPPTVRKTNPEDMPMMWIALSSDDPEEKPIDMMIFARTFLFDHFTSLSGVGNVVLGGYVDPALRVWVDLDKLEKHELTSSDVLASIASGHVEVPAGRLENKKEEFNIRVMTEAPSPEEFGKITIDNRMVLGPNYRQTRLGDVAKIEEGVADIRKIARYNRRQSIGLGILKQHGSNAVEVGKAVRQELKEIESLIPKRYHLTLSVDNTKFIKQSVDQLLFTLMLSAFLTSLVCYLFLGSWTSTMNVLMAIPTSIIGTFSVFYFFNFTLNTFTLLGLSLAIGIVVDDAIMMLENIVRHRELGEGKRKAALLGANEITFAAVAATVAVVAIFIPVVFMKGAIGKFFLQYGVTVTAAVLLSLLEALTLTPMRCSRYLQVNTHAEGFSKYVDQGFSKLAAKYKSLLKVLLEHRGLTMLVTAVVFALSLLSAKFLSGELMPAQDQSMFLMRFKLPVGSSLPSTSERLSQVENFLAKQPEVIGVFCAVGGFGGDAVNQGMAFVTLSDPKKRKLSQGEVMVKFRKELNYLTKAEGDKPPMEITIQDLSLRGFTASRGFPVEFIIQGPDWDKLNALSVTMMETMRKSGLVTDTNTDIQPGMPEVQLTPNRAKLAAHGVSLTTVTGVINAMVGGLILNHETGYSKKGHRYEIELRLKADQREGVPSLSRIKVRNNRGEMVPLSELVNMETKPSLMLISRLNRTRAITIYANPAAGISQNQALKAVEKLAKTLLPPGYLLRMTGSSQGFKESFQSLIFAMILGLVVSYMVLAAQFNSFIHPVTVLMALPFSFSGAFIGLLVCHQSINMFSIIGFILLMGIVKKNSILLVDFTNQVRNEGLDAKEALLKACPIRLRPILMTSLATVVGALPEALSIGPGSETTVPMAVAIIGGVIASTILTLFVVPVVYSLFVWLERPDSLDVKIKSSERDLIQLPH
jgi:hydrophobe/amphiphile efflux-1 (HAE1) family protein